MKSLLNPDTAIMTGVLLGAGSFLIYTNTLPSVAEISLSAPDDATLEKSRRQAAIQAAGLVGLVALLSRDLNVFIIGGASFVGMDYLYKHSNATNPGNLKLDRNMGGQTIAPIDDQPALPTYDGGGEYAGMQ